MEIKNILKIKTYNETETIECGRIFAPRLNDGDFIALYGDVGAGKTAFVKGIADIITPEAYVRSPTYALVNVYENYSNKRRICHFDMYRINGEDDLYSVGFDDYLTERKNIIIVEWCENVPFALPEEYYKITIEIVDFNSRIITIDRVFKNDNIGA